MEIKLKFRDIIKKEKISFNNHDVDSGLRGVSSFFFFAYAHSNTQTTKYMKILNTDNKKESKETIEKETPIFGTLKNFTKITT